MDVIEKTYKQCPYCGKFDMPPSVYKRNGSDYEDYSMVCNGIQYPQEDPFAAEIYGDTDLYEICDGEAYNSYMDI